MIPDERRKEILELLDEKGYVSVKDLSQRLYVSLPTIRRDLTLLEREGYVLRTHGGASLVYLTLLLNLLPCVKKQILKPKNILEKLRLPSSIIMILYLLPQVVLVWNSPTISNQTFVLIFWQMECPSLINYRKTITLLSNVLPVSIIIFMKESMEKK